MGSLAYDDWRCWASQDGARSPALKAFMSLPGGIQGELGDLMDRWLDGELTVNGTDCKKVQGEKRLWELRVRAGNCPYRLIFTISGRICIMLDAFYKNQQKLTTKQKKTWRKRRDGGGTSDFDLG